MSTETTPAAPADERAAALTKDGEREAIELLAKQIEESEGIMRDAMRGGGISEAQINVVRLMALSKRMKATIESFSSGPVRRKAFETMALHVFPSMAPDDADRPARDDKSETK